MVEYNPRGELPVYRDMTEEENFKLKRALDILFKMILKGSSLIDIQKVAAGLAEDVDWTYLDKVVASLGKSIERIEEEE